MKPVLISIGIIALVLFIGIGGIFMIRDPEKTWTPGVTSPAGEPVAKTPEVAQDSVTDTVDPAATPIEDQFVRELRKYYGGSIAKKSTQASLYDIRNSIMGSRPDGKAFFNNLLKRAFPNQADDIIATLDKLDGYNRWLAANQARLDQMTEAEKMAVLWEKRRELFGDDAEEIWSDEMLATETRKEKVQDALAFLNESRDTSMEEKLQVYQDTLKETYENSPEEYLLSQKPILAKVFFSIDSVQDELKQMDPDQRQMAINRIRREMGFTENQIEEMEKRDADRNQRWDVGLKYMEERRQIVAEYQGPDQEEQLKALREKYFQDEAGTIALEEKDAFFRFERPRFYGRN
ncbi:MAG: hypothetical protein ACOZF0_18155 [Thermodesulfobacteriota bacterium]